MRKDISHFSPHIAYSSTRLVYPMEVRRVPIGQVISWNRSSNSPPKLFRRALEEFYERIRNWEDSEDCKRLRSLFETTPFPKITKIVAFACEPLIIVNSP